MKRILLGLAVPLLALGMMGCPQNTVTVPVPPAPLPRPVPPTPTPQPQPPSGNADWTITVSFGYDFTNFVPCSASVTKGCIASFTWGYMQGSVPVPLKTSPASVCSGSSQPEACTDTTNATVGIGPVVPYCVANGFDNNGAAVQSSSVSGPTVAIAIGAPVGVSEAFR